MNYKDITDYLYNAVTDAHAEDNCKLDINFCYSLLDLLYESNHIDLIIQLFKDLRKESWSINKQNDTPDSILNYWCARTDKGLMNEPTNEVRRDIKAAENPMEIHNDGGGCVVCGRWNCKKVNHIPVGTKEQRMVAKESGWW